MSKPDITLRMRFDEAVAPVKALSTRQALDQLGDHWRVTHKLWAAFGEHALGPPTCLAQDNTPIASCEDAQ